MKFKFVVNTEDNTLRCIYDDRVIKMIENVGEIVSIKRISDIEPDKEGRWHIQYRVSPTRMTDHSFRSRAAAIKFEHEVVEDFILEKAVCKEFLGKAD